MTSTDFIYCWVSLNLWQCNIYLYILNVKNVNQQRIHKWPLKSCLWPLTASSSKLYLFTSTLSCVFNLLFIEPIIIIQLESCNNSDHHTRACGVNFAMWTSASLRYDLFRLQKRHFCYFTSCSELYYRIFWHKYILKQSCHVQHVISFYQGIMKYSRKQY